MTCICNIQHEYAGKFVIKALIRLKNIRSFVIKYIRIYLLRIGEVVYKLSEIVHTMCDDFQRILHTHTHTYTHTYIHTCGTIFISRISIII